MIISSNVPVAMVAAEDERRRFNAALARGKKPILKTAFGDFTVTAVSDEWLYSTAEGRTFCGGNNASWASLMKQADVARHSVFADLVIMPCVEC